MPSSNFNRNQVNANVTTIRVTANAKVTGVKGDQGATGAQGIPGNDGANGVGVPTGGTVGQVLAKNSSTNYDTSFKTLSKTDVGLSNVDNTSDLSKPISTLTQTALNAKQGTLSLTTTGTSGASTLIGNTLNIPQYSGGGGGTGTVTNVSSTSSDLTVTNPTTTPSLTVVSAPKITTARNINGVAFDGTANITVADATKEPIVTAGTTSQYYRGDKTFQTLDKTAVGLSNVDNTSDANKPVSTAQQTALNLKADDTSVVHLAGTETITGAKTFSLAPIMSVGEVLTPMATPAYQAGRLYFDSAEDALTFYSNDANVMLNIGQETFMRVTNNTGVAIANGIPVYINGQLAGLPTVAVASNANSTASSIIGLTTEALGIGATGYVTVYGKVRNMNTSALTLGSTVYVGSAGAITGAVNASLDRIGRIGTVLVVDATVGIIQVAPNGMPSFTAQGATTDLGTALSNLGLRTAGTAYPITTSGNVGFTGQALIGGAGYRSVAASRTATATLLNTSAWNNLCDATTASFVLTLPAATASVGQILWFKKTDSTANTVTIQRAGTDTIDGATSYVLTTQYKYVEFINNGTNSWFVRNNN